MLNNRLLIFQTACCVCGRIRRIIPKIIHNRHFCNNCPGECAASAAKLFY
ncbi:hypothetical protein LVJ85_01605 [Neisseria sp. Dent CA1/247]|nr:hypothetical protein [Neisseria sp. Dent CA1/247]UOO77222.1 hypothetical protein LVJ85_01605 [Neisseria sp. Dent CA1/247]